MINRLLILLRIKTLDKDLLDRWSNENQTDLIAMSLRYSKPKQQLEIVRMLDSVNLDSKTINELIKIIVSSDLHIANTAGALLRHVDSKDSIIIDRCSVALEVLDIRNEKQENFTNFLKRSGNRDSILINKEKMKRLDSLKKQLKRRMI